MTERISVAQFRALKAKGGSKYHATAAVVQGQRFDSKLEADRYVYWNTLWQAHAIAWFICQVPFKLPGNITYRLDFMVMHLDGAILFEDTKGVLTRVSANKIKQVQAIYGIKIELITRASKKPR